MGPSAGRGRNIGHSGPPMLLGRPAGGRGFNLTTQMAEPTDTHMKWLVYKSHARHWTRGERFRPQPPQAPCTNFTLNGDPLPNSRTNVLPTVKA